MRKHRVLIVDDHSVVRQGIRAALQSEADIELIAEAASGLAALEIARDSRPDIVVLDLTLPDLDGAATIQALRESAPKAKIVVLSMHEHAEIARVALRAGASAYVLKSDATSELAAAIRKVAQGTTYLSGHFAAVMLSHFLNPKPAPQPPQMTLTPKEREIITLIASGRKNRQIAADLGLSTRTVESHRHRVMRKMKFGSLSDLVRFALRHQLVEP